jgi:RNA polymerase sigma factor (sigma-70 family)
VANAASDSSCGGDGYWDKTHWSVILAVEDPRSPNHQQAREQFARAYWRPVYKFVRKKGHSREEAQDLTQEFFMQLLENGVLAGVTREGGKFRSVILKYLTNFLTSEWKRERTQKRGGGQTHIPFEEINEAACQKELADQETPEALFDRNQAQAVVDQVLLHLRAEYVAEGNGRLYDCLQGFLPGGQEEISQEEAARRLHMSIEAVRVALHRMRERARKLLCREVAAPGMKSEEVDAELKYLLSALVRH